ncbi:hypothetical protein E2320_000792 [Naja naja]|nr:hypothetical protein E2320_000792 [Naja naja]
MNMKLSWILFCSTPMEPITWTFRTTLARPHFTSLSFLGRPALLANWCRQEPGWASKRKEATRPCTWRAERGGGIVPNSCWRRSPSRGPVRATVTSPCMWPFYGKIWAW